MLGPARYLADFLRFASAKGDQERHDADALRELELTGIDLPAGLALEWLGVSGYRLTYERETILIDPYVSRVPLRSLIRRTPAMPDSALIERHIGSPEQILAVLVGHTHFDHAVDAPAIARRFDCPVYGSGSLTQLMRTHGLGRLAVQVQPHRRYELGPFTISFTPSLHSKLLLGLAVPFDGELTCDHLDGLHPGAYRCGQVWGIHIEVAGMTFYHQGSANLREDELRHRKVDVFLAGVAGRGFTKDYWGRILPLLEPRIVVPTHYDDFFAPLDERELSFSTNVKLARVPEEIAKVSADFKLAALPRLREVGATESGSR